MWNRVNDDNEIGANGNKNDEWKDFIHNVKDDAKKNEHLGLWEGIDEESHPPVDDIIKEVEAEKEIEELIQLIEFKKTYYDYEINQRKKKIEKIKLKIEELKVQGKKKEKEKSSSVLAIHLLLANWNSFKCFMKLLEFPKVKTLTLQDVMKRTFHWNLRKIVYLVVI